jgi:peroxiredoxin
MSSARTSLTDATETVRGQLHSFMGDELFGGLDAAAEEIAQIDFAKRAPDVGESVSDFELPDVRGGAVRLSDLLRKGRVVLIFYRGGWCPYCNIQLAALRDRQDEIIAAGATVVAISPQMPSVALSHADQTGLPFPILADEGNRVAREYGLLFALDDNAQVQHRAIGLDLGTVNGDSSWELAAPATFLLDGKGTVRWRAVSGDWRWRPGPDEILEALGATSR